MSKPGRIDWLKILVIVVILVWPFGQLLILPSPWGQIRWYVLDILAVAVALLTLWQGNWKPLFLAQPLFKPLIIFVLVLGLSLILALPRLTGWEILISGAYWLRLVFLSLVYFALRAVPWAAKKPWLLIAAAIFLLLGFGQYLVFPDTRQLAFFGFDDHYYRFIGSFFDPNFTGLILAGLTLLTLMYFQDKRKLLAAIPLLGLALTFSRASYLAFAVGLVYLVIRKHTLPALGLLPLLFAFILLAPKPFGEGVNLTRTFSITSRVQNQISGLKLWQERPLLGQGFNTLSRHLPAISEKFTPVRVGGIDNSFVYILATSGVLGLGAFLFLLFSLWRLTSGQPTIQAVLLMILIHSWWNNSFFYSWIFTFVLVLADYASFRVPQTKQLGGLVSR